MRTLRAPTRVETSAAHATAGFLGAGCFARTWMSAQPVQVRAMRTLRAPTRKEASAALATAGFLGA
eukprot:2584577-Rhodomonas_salina.1